MQIERRERHTIMDGKVVMFALRFNEEKGILGQRHVAAGPFEVSASRDAVMVHRANCYSKEAALALAEAIKQATTVAANLAREDRGNFRLLTDDAEEDGTEL